MMPQHTVLSHTTLTRRAELWLSGVGVDAWQTAPRRSWGTGCNKALYTIWSRNSNADDEAAEPRPAEGRAPRGRARRPRALRFPPPSGGRGSTEASGARTPTRTRGPRAYENRSMNAISHTTLPSCSRDVGNYHPLADQAASRPQPRAGLADA